MGELYESEAAFYAADRRRAPSPEADYGVWWTDGGEWPHYRVSYLRFTGEVIAVRMGNPSSVEVLGYYPPDPGAAPYAVWYRGLDAVLDGWPEACCAGFSLDWIRQKLEGASKRIITGRIVTHDCGWRGPEQMLELHAQDCWERPEQIADAAERWLRGGA